MDPFSAEGELVNIHTAWTRGQYESVLSDFDPSSFSESNRITVQVLQYCAQCALGKYDEVLSSVEGGDSAELLAVKAYATYLRDGSEEAVAEAESLSETQGDNLTVQLLCGTVLAASGKPEQAVALLSRHQGSLDAVALIVQIHLTQNRTDLALKEARSARGFAQDALLVNLAESWIGMRQGGDNYQKSFYVFEELAQGPSTASATSLTAQAVSELHMGRIEEAETALNQALTLDPNNSAALANKIVLDILAGRDASGARAKLQSADSKYESLQDVAAKKEAFQAALEKYTPKFEP